ncbi:hydrolase [Amycolatopsis balhimycina DSM 5908]|uniref:alpha-L-rhamnosidase n=1 Tax=Amycolatopsis balhimycina DSM 5908 TaxID=1081091 RepID=A0A428WVD2_AMYBA|nr:family 78 glycoside hydrolase catalytic domain [Amycolatopsis balhimycina]RSM46960.1 hydrolase [Amycolatopsis balhimycina DSM 5908]
MVSRLMTASSASLILLVLGVTPAGAYPAAPVGGLQAGGLQVEHQADPLGVDVARPRLGWVLNAKGSTRQSAYRIAVSTERTGPANVWDSGEVRSSQSFDVTYAGPALRARTRYFWRVQVWDATQRASRWSEPAWFETAFLAPGQFQGDWIGAPTPSTPPSFDGASWIWYPGGNPADSAPAGTRYFRRTFELPAGEQLTAARLDLTADDSFTVYLNGQQVAVSPPVADSWRTATVVDVSAALRPGRNVIAAQATNATPGPAGFLGKLRVEGAGDPFDLVTDGAWKSADTAPAGWQQPGFDDTAWPQALVAAPYGAGPWGSSVTTPPPPEPLLRKEFTAEKPIRSARAYIAGLGYYQLYLNGGRIGDHELDPAFTVYDKTALYATYDVTDALRAGRNAVGVSLGRGYYAMTNPDEWVASPWHSEPKLKLELDITYQDGSTQQVTSGSGWKVADGPTRTESLWFGETYDARLEQPGWTRPGFADTGWRQAVAVSAPAGTLRAEAFPPIKVTGKLPVTGVTTPSDGVRVYDVGTTTAGWARVAVRGPVGAQVKITYGEKLRPDGTADNTGGFGMQLQSYTYILKGDGLETYRPSYSYAGFRYVQIAAPPGVTVESVTPERVHTAVATTGGFTSSSPLLNRYDDAEANTILNNLHSVPTDTPMYEKRPYTADAQLSADSAIAHFDMRNFYENWMRAHRDDQNPDGTIGQTVPATVGGKKVTDPVWSASFVLINWDLYWYYGDTRPLADNYGAMKAWLGHYEQDIAKTGNIYAGFSYGDWLAPGAAYPPEGTRLAGTAYLHQTATTMARIARALGHDNDAEHFETLAATIANALNATFFDKASGAYYDDRSAGYRQTSNLLPLSLGIVPAADRPAVVAHLVDDVKTRGVHLNTGALGTKLILPALTDAGYGDLAYQVATNPTYPGWGYWFTALGATTMWEEWPATSRSHDHAFLGTVDDWLYQRVAGIQPAAPGYTAVKIRPYPVGDLTNASAHVESPLGQVSSAWTRERGRFTLRAGVPVGATAEVFVPARDGRAVQAPPDARFEGMRDGYAAFRVGAGDHVFRSAR